ncbi:MAG: hypothetical protein LQ348_003828 [Seirophora lacunosa]|nr:MAG: hypothetical protein LQ348_003828 [Seirophora lacunosa]
MPTRARLNTVPVEILHLIMSKLPSLSDLRVFITSCKRARSVYLQHPAIVILDILAHSNLGSQIQWLFVRTMTLESYRDLDAYTEIFDRLHNMDRETLKTSLAVLFDKDKRGPVEFLLYVDDMMEEISDLEQSFIKAMLAKASARLPEPDAEQSPPTRMELHRVRRAIWRLIFFYKLFHLPPQGSLMHEDRNLFHRHLTSWELDEMLSVYHYVKQTVCPKRLMICWIPCRTCSDFGLQISGQGSMETDAEIPPQLWAETSASSLPHQLLGTSATLSESFLIDHEPSAGSKFTSKYMGDRLLSRCMWHWFHDMVDGCFIQWAYCIWDAERMRAWQLIPDRPDGLRADSKRWPLEGRGPCLGCDRHGISR